MNPTPAHRTVRSCWAALLGLTLGLPDLALAAPDPDLATLLRQHSIRPVEPAVAASDFRLTALAGGEASLSDFRGTWVVLTFWATWCGPCRSELPTLERLHRARAGAGLTVLGVSTDQRREPAAAYLGELGISFPNLWDAGQEVARAYRATAIPLSYLIDPGGRIVGLSRGARDWSALEGLVDAVLAKVPPDAAAPGGYRAAADPRLPLPPTLEPPSATVALPEPAPRVGAPFYLDIELRWAGHLEDYLPYPPKLHLPSGIEQRGISAHTSSETGRNLVTYRVALAAAEPGTYALDPVEVRYTPRLESSPVASRIPGLTVAVAPRTVAGLAPGTWAWGGGAALALGLAAWGLGRRRRHRPAPAADPRLARIEERFAAARQLRLGGDGAASFLALAEAEAALAALAGQEPAADLALLAEAVRYGGQVPAAEDLMRLERRVARQLAEVRPDPGAAARAAVRLAPGSDLGGRGAGGAGSAGTRSPLWIKEGP